MTAGANIKVTIYRMTPGIDDYAGGVSITGSMVYSNLQARMQANPEEQMYFQQGLETLRTFNMVIHPGNLDIRERDEAEITFPPSYPYINSRFRIIRVRYSDFNDARKYMILFLTRSVRAHTEQ